MMWGTSYPWWPNMLVMLLGAVIWIPFLVLAIWALVHWISRMQTSSRLPAEPPARQHDAAMDALRERYARGEIDTAAFDELHRHLDEAKHPTGDAAHAVTHA